VQASPSVLVLSDVLAKEVIDYFQGKLIVLVTCLFLN
jgi:hypothetical protein